jgi:hypothetical protein
MHGERNLDLAAIDHLVIAGWTQRDVAHYGSLGGGTSETLRDLIGKRLLAEIGDKDGLLGLGDA